jgi:hypothetical protein
MNIDDRLRAAGSALREGSATQVDADSALRVILLHADPVAEEPDHQPPPSPSRPATWLLRRPQRLALAVNLLLVMALGVALVVVVQRGQDAGTATSIPPQPTVAAVTPSSVIVTQTRTSVPEACLDAAELADEAISRLNRGVRDERLFLALRDYTIASQACRREASP